MSKLGFHINYITNSSKMYSIFAYCQPTIIKSLHHDLVFWQRVKKACPYTFLLGRYYVEDQFLVNPEVEAVGLAKIISELPVAKIYHAWEGYNETPRELREKRYIFDIIMAQELHKYGLKYCCGSWSVGVPDIEDWLDTGMLESLLNSDYISVHEYCAPTMNDPRGLLSGGSRGWFTLRYRQWYPQLPLDCQKPLIISECGIDSGAAHWEVSGEGGWRAFTTPQGYLEQLKWYDSCLIRDDWVIGGCIYCWGTLDPQWDSWDIEGTMLDLLANYIYETRGELPPPPTNQLERRVTAIEEKIHQISIILASTT